MFYSPPALPARSLLCGYFFVARARKTLYPTWALSAFHLSCAHHCSNGHTYNGPVPSTLSQRFHTLCFHVSIFRDSVGGQFLFWTALPLTRDVSEGVWTLTWTLVLCTISLSPLVYTQAKSQIPHAHDEPPKCGDPARMYLQGFPSLSKVALTSLAILHLKSFQSFHQASWWPPNVLQFLHVPPQVFPRTQDGAPDAVGLSWAGSAAFDAG